MAVLIRYIFTILCSAFSLVLAAQDFSHRRYQHNWTTRVEEDIPVDSQWISNGAVILFEEWNVRPEQQTIEVYQRIRFFTENAIQQYLPLRLPLAPDPYWTAVQGFSWQQLPPAFQWGGESALFWIDARLIRDHDFEKVVISEKAYSKQSRPPGTVDWNYAFYFLNLQPGDELEIVYKYRYHSGTRFYLCGTFPRQELLVRIATPTPYVFHTELKNIQAITDTTMQKNGRQFHRSVNYQFSQLPPARISFNQIPSEILPHLMVYPNRYAEYSGGMFDNKPAVRPYLWDHYFRQFTRRDEYDLYSEIVEIYDQPTTWVNQRYDSLRMAAEGDTALYFYLLQSSFSRYDFRKTVPGKERANYLFEVTDALKSNLLYEEHVLRITEELIFRSRVPFFLGLPADRRVDSIEVQKPRTFYSHHPYSVVKTGNQYIFLPLRNSPVPYFANELPFFLEGSSTLLIPRTVPPDIHKYYRHRVPYQVIISPEMPAEHNSRYMHTQIAIEDFSGHVRAEVVLNGQFSTCTRGVYMYNYLDSLVNPGYGKRLFDWGNEHMRALSVSALPPYTCSFRLEGDPGASLEFRDSLVLLNMRDIFLWITDTLLSPDAPYRADFAGADSGTVWVRSAKNLECLNSADFLRKYEQPGYAFHCQVSQPDAQTLKIEYSWKLKKQRYTARETAELKALFRDMEQLKNTPFLFREK